jgi:hypothetical protein
VRLTSANKWQRMPARRQGRGRQVKSPEIRLEVGPSGQQQERSAAQSSDIRAVGNGGSCERRDGGISSGLVQALSAKRGVQAIRATLV